MSKIISYKNIYPTIHSSVFLAEGAKIIGDVTIEEECSVWFNSVIRGDVQKITIGKRTNIQDNCTLHVTNKIGPLVLANDVTIGHNVVLHACMVKEFTLIGMGAILLDNCVIEPYSIVGAGSLVKQGFVVPSGHLVAGVPAKIIRPLNEEEKKNIGNFAERYVQYSKTYLENNK